MIKTNDHESEIIYFHGEQIEIDIKMIQLIKKINKNKL